MDVAQYTFQSPYSSPLQVGRLDPSSVKEEGDSAPVVNEPLGNSQSFETTQVSEVTPTLNSNQLLDVYA